MNATPAQAGVRSPSAAGDGDFPGGGNASDLPASQDPFRRFSHGASAAVDSPWAFIAALAIVIGWAASGPLFGFTDTWQLVINTSTTIVTFLMVFLIQNTQNRDARAMHLKLDEIVRAISDADDELIDIEEASDPELDRLEHGFKALHRRQGR